jgi:hypothetical protein
MPVISLSSQDVGSTLPLLLRAQEPPSEHDSKREEKKDERLHVSHSSNSSIDSTSNIGFQPRTGPTPISPIPESPATFPPSSPTQRPIPPPPTPRRHKSGVLLSRVRAHTGGNTFKSSSRSFGDLSESALGMSCMGDDAGPSMVNSHSVGSSPSKRIVSEGARNRDRDDDDEEDMWDNR